MEITDLQTHVHSEDDIRSIVPVLKRLNLNATHESADAMLNLIDFTCKLNGSERPIIYPGDTLLNLHSINIFMQHNFFDRIPVLGSIVPITDERKINMMEEHSNELDNWFEIIGLHNPPAVNENNINDIISNLESSRDNKLIIRIMGNNELILEQQFRRAREILEQIPEDLRGQIDVKLLGKTNINMFFGEDRESEILIMKRLGRNWLGDLGCQISSVAKVGNANTIDTVRKEESNRVETGGETIVLDILCPNGAERQREDIELEKLKQKKKILERKQKIDDELEKTKSGRKKMKLKKEQEDLRNKLLKMEKEKHFYDGCGGVRQLRDMLNHNKCGADLDEHQLAFIYYNEYQNLSKFGKYMIKNDFKRFSNLTDKLNKIYLPNMLVELAKLIYCIIQCIEIQRETNLAETNLSFKDSSSAENSISFDGL